MATEDLEKLDTYIVGSMVAKNIEAISELKESQKKLKKQIDKLKNQLKFLSKKITE
ncbi:MULTISPECIES: hypothetical protein [Prochlorococcus]|nr:MULTISPECIES: hypothetical protein [Prochlorococcus]KGG13408.1 hypothetical protein EV04_0643 [Prochlorococcus marinus str. LG]KGG21348.1 hypothetical protein EV08_0756 [Prochlorococcus marinus str. SS2]KGG24320.1 hypothetical protein EV09_0367 [Prochlorococcus marinus str. SS35]KGG33604.1 hypothetical protein EV10_0444 [Prochlorococcus marinus str. SS51]KGG36480.1 hypothetical protein EV11_0852 [Prochlorococcus sp. SS52]